MKNNLQSLFWFTAKAVVLVLLAYAMSGVISYRVEQRILDARMDSCLERSADLRPRSPAKKHQRRCLMKYMRGGN